MNEDQSFADIPQTLKLRVVPFTATFKLLPFGTDSLIQPYVGAGVGILAYRYSETGHSSTSYRSEPGDFPGNFVGSGAATGPLVLGGLRAATPFGTLGGEIRYQYGVATLPSDKGFAGSKIDLGGFNYLFTISFKL